jgi:outer membrane immunogenic protein
LRFTAVVLPVVTSLGTIAQPSITAAQTASNWSGPSANVTAGGAWGTSSQHDDLTILTCTTLCGGDGHYNIGGALAGGGFGYNWQNGLWVAGLTADISGGNVRGSSNNCGVAPGHLCGTKLNELVTARGILGYANGIYLPYLTAGAAWADIHAFDALFAVSGSKVQTGLAVGGGLEIKFDPRASFKIEYLYIDFGKANIFDIVPGTPEQIRTKVNVLRAGFTWYFGDPMGKAPVVAKY